MQIGTSLGSMFGQTLRLSEERIRTLVAGGAASAIAAAFNATIAGFFFALEILLGEAGGTGVGLILVAAVTSSVFTQDVSTTHAKWRGTSSNGQQHRHLSPERCNRLVGPDETGSSHGARKLSSLDHHQQGTGGIYTPCCRVQPRDS